MGGAQFAASVLPTVLTAPPLAVVQVSVRELRSDRRALKLLDRLAEQRVSLGAAGHERLRLCELGERPGGAGRRRSFVELFETASGQVKVAGSRAGFHREGERVTR